MERSATYALTEKDAVAVAQIAARMNLTRPKMLALLASLYAAILALLLVLMGMERWRELVIAGVVAPPIAIWLIARFVLPAQARSHFRQTKALQCETSIAWDARGMKLASELGQSQLAWSDYRRVVEKGGYVLLFQSDMLYNTVPMAALDEAQRADFRALAGLANADVAAA